MHTVRLEIIIGYDKSDNTLTNEIRWLVCLCVQNIVQITMLSIR